MGIAKSGIAKSGIAKLFGPTDLATGLNMKNTSVNAAPEGLSQPS